MLLKLTTANFFPGIGIESMDGSVSLFIFPRHVRLDLGLFWTVVPGGETPFGPRKDIWSGWVICAVTFSYLW